MTVVLNIAKFNYVSIPMYIKLWIVWFTKPTTTTLEKVVHSISKYKMFLRVSLVFAVFFLLILEKNVFTFAFEDDFINDFEVDNSIKQKETIKSLTLPGKLL